MPSKRKNTSQEKAVPAVLCKEIIPRLPAIICELNPDGKTVYVNQTVTKILGYGPDEIIGKNWWDIFCSTENRHDISRIYEQIKNGDVTDYELDLIDKNSNPVSVNWNSTNLYSETKKFLKVVGIAVETSGKRDAQEALRNTLERYKILIENQGEGFAVVDENEIITFANPAAEELFGVGEGELLDRSLEEFTSKNGFDEVKDQTEKRRVGEKSSYDLEIIRPDGKKRCILVTCTAQFDSLGNYKGAFGVFRDITERKRAIDALKRERDRAQRYLDIAGTVIMMLDFEGKLRMLNKKGCQIFGLKEREIIGESFTENFLHENSRQSFRNHFSELIEGLKEGSEDFETLIITQLGEEKILSWNFTVLKNDNGNILGLLGSGEDITQRKNTEVKILNSEKKYRELYENMTDGVATVDISGTITQCNNAFKKLTGYSEKELNTLTYKDITPKHWHKKELNILEDQVLKRGYSDIYTKEYIRKDGKTIPVELTTYLIKNGRGKPAGMWAIVREIKKK